VGAVFEGADHQIRVEDLDVVPGFDLAGMDLARSGGPEAHPLRALAMHAQADAFDVQNDVGDVFENPRQRGKLVQYALDLQRGDRRPLERGQQHTAQRIAERQTETAFQWLGDHRGDAFGITPRLDRKLLGFDQGLPVLLQHDDLNR